MAAVDFSALNAVLGDLSANVGKVATAIGAPTDAEQRIAELEAELAASQAAEADLAAKFKEQSDALAALVPPAA